MSAIDDLNTSATAASQHIQALAAMMADAHAAMDAAATAVEKVTAAAAQLSSLIEGEIAATQQAHDRIQATIAEIKGKAAALANSTETN